MISGQPGAQQTDAASPKNIVVCFDGTNNLLDHHATNAAKIFMMLDLDHPRRQLAYYDPGVGTLPAAGAIGRLGKAWSQLGGLAFGWGMQTNITQAYAWLMNRYRPGDKIYVFGFSRGAFTARAFAALLARPGMLRAGSDNLVEYAVKEYVRPVRTKKLAETRKREAKEFADALCWGTAGQPVAAPPGTPPDDFLIALGQRDIHAVPVEYLGVWDTVESWFGGLGRLDWADTASLWNVRTLRHAVAIDEWRVQFGYSPVKHRAGFEEVWFAGVHCDVGGTFANHDLAKIALKWVFEGTGGDLLLRDGDWNEVYRRFCTVTGDFGPNQNTVNKDPWAYHLLGATRRRIPAGACVHASVRARQQADPTYRLNLADAAVPPVWVDENWAEFVERA
ncbi:phospholipase effector Tle1 domain-containing protein [Humibacter ginsenosidimutans]|uniref:DUF2235 domain-containing protein n=1 Tax=Humibacter ginsenosidimutans TaxID=2599293 RepID=A0A5B8M5J1_9MICO|nr:DUF2235 domain-containing protein [Humibacter ginsenosidimutans]QDZ15214.1 DUF2235 domain-containing protein [Humibacter ginsenosidimutans]